MYIYIYIYILENGETIRGKSGRNQGICFTKLSGHPVFMGPRFLFSVLMFDANCLLPSFLFLFLLNQDIWPDIKVAINASQKYTTDMLTNKTSLAGIVTSDTISARQQQMGDFFTDVRARARNLDHDWRKVRDAHIKVWKTIKSEPTTQEFYQLLNHDFRSIFRNETPKETTHLLQPFIDELKVGQPWELYYRTNADMPSINETEQVEKTKESFALLKEQTDILSSIDGKDDNFLFTFHRWRSSLVNFIAGSEIDERFLKYG